MNPPVEHPGTRVEPRAHAIPTETVRFPIDIPDGATIEPTILAAFAAAGVPSGFVIMDGLACAPLRYVMPAASPTPDRFAWYSAPLEAQGTFLSGYMSVGRDGDNGFTHCHGHWGLADGTQAIGHLLGPESVAAEPITLQATGFRNAVFSRRPCPETRFDLFHATAFGDPAGKPDAVVLTLKPNQNILTACRAACPFANATLHGLGSLNGAAFESGAHMPSPITEFLIRSGDLTHLDIAIIDEAENQRTGPLNPAHANVSVTAELVLLANQPPT